MKIRKLKLDECTVVVKAEPDDLPVRGNAAATDDPERDREIENEILADLDRGFIAAWCCVVVTVRWQQHFGRATLGCVSLDPKLGQDTHEILCQTANDHDLISAALDDLNDKMAKLAEQVGALVQVEDAQ